MTNLCLELPRIASDVGIVVIRKIGTNNNIMDLRVRKDAISVWLIWLKNNNQSPGYRGLQISQNHLDLLPSDGFIELTTIETTEEPDLETHLPVSDQNERHVIDCNVLDEQEDEASIPCGQGDIEDDILSQGIQNMVLVSNEITHTGVSNGKLNLFN